MSSTPWPAFSRRRVGQLGEAVLGGVERGEPLRRHARRGALGGQALELGADEERLAQLVARERADANAAVRLERDEAERGQPAQRLADRRAADVEALGEQLLAENRAGGDRAGDDLVLEDDRDVVGLRRIRHHGGVYDASRQLARRPRCGRSRRRSASPRRRLASCGRGEVGAAEAAARAGEPAAARVTGGVDLAAAVLARLERDAALALAGLQVPDCRDRAHAAASSVSAANCASSVEPVSARVEALPPLTMPAIASK